jgi:hypothetical protein
MRQPGGVQQDAAGLFFIQRLADQRMPRGAKARSQVSAATGWLKQ